MSNLYNIPAPKSDETANEVHARQMAEYPHNHGAGLGEPFISRNVTQDHAETPCVECGRRTAGESYAHEIGCSGYLPHPDSIAGHLAS